MPHELDHLVHDSLDLSELASADRLCRDLSPTLLHLYDVIILVVKRLLLEVLNYSQFVKHSFLHVFPPTRKGLENGSVLDSRKEPSAGYFCPVVEMPLPADESNSLKHFTSEASSNDGADDVDCILLLLDVALPRAKDVFEFGHVYVVRLSVRPNFECLFEIALK